MMRSNLQNDETLLVLQLQWEYKIRVFLVFFVCEKIRHHFKRFRLQFVKKIDFIEIFALHMMNYHLNSAFHFNLNRFFFVLLW